MPEHLNDDSPCTSQKRVQPFLDCVSYLLAKRWLRDQRQEPEEPPQEKPSHRDESPAS